MSDVVDVVVIGGGLIGLATGYRLLQERPDLSLAVVEKERVLAAHQSGRNSGVVHSGIYYRPGSLKARLCRDGKRDLERFAEEHGIAYERCGKLVIAVRRSELGRLADLEARARANGVEGLEAVGPERMREIEPRAGGIRALHCASTGIIDFRAVANALGDEIRSRGGRVLLEHRVVGITERSDSVELRSGAGGFRARAVINCGGLQSDRLAAMTGGRGLERIVPFRGTYFQLSAPARRFVRGLIYPVPDPSLPFLGVHFTRRIDGGVWVGPNAVLALAREGYRRWDVDLRDLFDVLGFSGFRRLAVTHARTGLGEIWRDLVKSALVRECRRYVSEVRAHHLVAGPSGIRAQSVREDGALVDDFSIQSSARVMHVRNAPSPGATASLAIGRTIGRSAVQRLEMG